MVAETIRQPAQASVIGRQFTAQEFERLFEVGILADDERVELIEGEIVQMSPINVAHSSCVLRLNALLAGLSRGMALIGVQGPIRLDARTVPQPDVAVLTPRADYYRKAHPGPGDVLLLIEVADTSLSYDRNVKSLVYARFGIQDYWIVDLSGRTVEVHREPRGDRFRTTTRHSGEDSVALLAFPDVVLSVADILG